MRFGEAPLASELEDGRVGADGVIGATSQELSGRIVGGERFSISSQIHGGLGVLAVAESFTLRIGILTVFFC
jgi:hypothetical protein